MKKFDPCSSDRISREIPIGPVIHMLDKMLSRNMAAQMRAYGIDEITLMHGRVIRYLYEKRDDEIFQKDIERDFSIGRSSVTNIIQLMERNGYITRESVPGDARLKKVKLTDKGITNHKRVESFITRLDKELIQGITEEELNTFYTVMNKIRGNLRAAQTAGEEDDHAACIIKRSEGI